MSFARYASATSPLAYRPPPRPKPKPQADHGVYFGLRYKLRNHNFYFVPERFPRNNDYTRVVGTATGISDGTVVRDLQWEVRYLELVDEV